MEPINVYGEPIEEVDLFIYLGSAMDKTGGTDADIKARKGKARSATLSSRLKVRAYNATIEPVLLYGSETRRMNNTPTNKVLSFVNTCPHTLARDYLKYLVVGKNKPSTCQG